jgi:hypothetical protein
VLTGKASKVYNAVARYLAIRQHAVVRLGNTWPGHLARASLLTTFSAYVWYNNKWVSYIVDKEGTPMALDFTLSDIEQLVTRLIHAEREHKQTVREIVREEVTRVA